MTQGGDRQGPRHAAPWRSAFLAALAYFVAGVLLTWPVALSPATVLFGDYGDTRGWGWWVWAKANGHLDGAVNMLLGAPYGLANTRAVTHPIPDTLVVALARASDEITAINLVILMAFPLTALATYVLAERLLASRMAAFFAGLVFGFCPAAVMQAAGGHATFALNLFVPLFVLALFHNRARRTVLSALLVGMTFAAITFTAIYMGYFALFVGLFFVVFDFVTRGDEAPAAMARNYLYCASFAVLCVLPAEFAAIREQLTASSAALLESGHARDFSDLFAFSARPWNYLTPSIDHPVVGRFLEGFVRTRLNGSNVFEQTLYLGLVPLALLATGLIIAALGRFQPPYRRYFFFFSLGAALMYFMSLPPVIGQGLPTPSYYLHEIAPMFRAYVRFGLLVNLFVACAAAVVLAHIAIRMASGRYYALLAILLPLLVFEYWSVPPAHARPVAQPRDVHAWLAREPGDIIVAEYPMVRFDEPAFYTYAFWQRMHGKRLVNGASPDNREAWALFERVGDLSNPDTPIRLRAAGVKYVVVHTDMYRDGPVPAPIKRYYEPARAALAFNGGVPPAIAPSLRLHKRFGPDLVFTLPEEKTGN